MSPGGIGDTVTIQSYCLTEDNAERPTVHLQIALPEFLVQYRKFGQFTKSLKEKKKGKPPFGDGGSVVAHDF